jgi:hypothetical protein
MSANPAGRGALAFTAAWIAAARAEASELRTGYQLGVAQSAGTTVTNNQDLIVESSATPPAARLQGVTLTTNAGANVTLDMATNVLSHAAIAGASIGQILPFAVPGAAVGAVDARVTTLQATAQYLGRVEQQGWGLAFGGGYALGSNGQLGTGADGSVQGGGAGATVPGTQIGAFLVNGITHTVNARAQFQITQLRWDLTLLSTYVFARNGVFNLAPTIPGSTQASPSLGASTNIGGFVQATTHTWTPLLTYRARVGESNLFSASAQSIFTMPLPPDDTTANVDGRTISIHTPQPIAKTLYLNGSLAWLYNATIDRAFGVRAISVFNLRDPTSALTEEPEKGGPVRPDALIYGGRALYIDLLPWRLRVNAEVGAAQPWIFQAPFGQYVPFDAHFDRIRGKWTPIFTVTVQRFFEPITATLGVVRDVSVGALGASALVNETASLSLLYRFKVIGLHAELPAALSVGFNANQRRGIGSEQFRQAPQPAPPPCDPTMLPPGTPCPGAANALAVALDSRGFGANALASMRLYQEGDFALDTIVSYNFNWLDADPDGVQASADGTIGRRPFMTHIALVTFRGAWGRGPLAAPPGGAMLGPFATGQDGLPLGSTRLLSPDAPLLDNARGARPGLPANEQRDSIEVYERTREQLETERKAQQRIDAVRGNETLQEEERSSEEQQEKEREERRKRRLRTFRAQPREDEDAPQGD